MASKFASSVDQASDIIYDYPCTICEDNDLNKEALFYCDSCVKLYCDNCATLHNGMYKKHKLLGQKDVDKWGVAKKTIQGEQCPLHAGNVIQMFCGDHDVVCCTVCISLDHRSCRRVDHIPLVAKDILQSKDFRALQSKLKSSQGKLKKKKSGKKQARKALHDTCKNLVQSVKDLRKRLDQHMARLEKKTIELIEELRYTFDAILEADENDIDKAERNIQQFLDYYNDKAQKTEHAGFICMKNYQRYLTEVDRMMDTITDKPFQIHFKPYLGIEEQVFALESLGQFETSPTHVAQTHSPTTPVSTTSHGQNMTADVKPQKAYTIENIQKYNSCIKCDIYTCCIMGLCGLPNGNILAADFANNRVKQVNEKFAVISHLNLPSSPWDICHLGDYQAVVTVGKEINFLDARGGQLKLTRMVKLDHKCPGIAHYNGQLYVTSGTTLYLYTRDGQMVKKMYKDISGGSNTVHKLGIADDGSRIFISNSSKHCIVTLDGNGKRLETFTNPDLQSPSGICVADNGAVFVSSVGSGKVLQLSSDGKRKLAALAVTKDWGEYPQSLMINRRSSQLLVGQQSVDSLLVIDLKEDNTKRPVHNIAYMV